MARLKDIRGYLVRRLSDPASREQFIQRIARNTEMTPEGCALWKAAKTGGRMGVGYGDMSVWHDGKDLKVRVHRLMWVLFTGENIPEDMEPDHTCHNTACWNPRHMQLTTRTQNAHRSAVNTNGKKAAKANGGGARGHSPKAL